MEDNTVIFKGQKYGVSFTERNGEWVASIMLENMKHITATAADKDMAKLSLDVKLHELEEKAIERKRMD